MNLNTYLRRVWPAMLPVFVVVALSLVLGSAGILISQIRLDTDLVVVPVSVRDTKGEFVTDLTKEDFIVLEDGQPQTITNFDNDPQKMSAAIVIDDGVSANSLKRVSSLLFAITAGFTTDDEMAVFRYDHVVSRLSDFSSGPRTLEKSFKVVSDIADSRQPEPEELIKGGPGWLRSIFGVFEYGNKSDGMNHVLHDAIFEANAALKSRSTERRKVILVVSDGRVTRGNMHSLKENTDLLLQNNIQVFGVSTDYAKFGSFGALSDYASATGGDVHDGGTDKTLEHAFNQVTEQARHQYILGYTSRNTKSSPGAFRTITVKTRESNLKVIHRKGYVRFAPQ